MSPDSLMSTPDRDSRPRRVRRLGRVLLALVMAALLIAASGGESGGIARVGAGVMYADASSVELHAGCDSAYIERWACPSSLQADYPTVTLDDPTAALAGFDRSALDLSFDRDVNQLCEGSNGTGTAQLNSGDWGDAEEYEVADAQMMVAAAGVVEVTGRWYAVNSGTSGYLQAVLWGNEEFGAMPCPDEAWTFTGVMQLVPENGEPVGLLDLVPPRIDESEKCQDFGGTRVADTTAQGVRSYVYVHQPSVDELWVCARVHDANTGEGYGGRLELTPTGLDPQATVEPSPVPSVDGNSSACTSQTSNGIPGSHPIASGGIGPFDYMVDAYDGYEKLWVCVKAGPEQARVKVSTSAPDGASASTGTVAEWHPDEGTP